MAPTERQTIDGLLSMLRDAGAIQEVREARLITDGMQNLVLVVDEELVDESHGMRTAGQR